MKGKVIVIAIVALAVAVISKFLLPTGDPHVVVRAESIFDIAGNPALPFANSLTVMLLVDILLIVVALLATSKMDMVPRGMQNLVEAVIEMFYNLFAGVNREWLARGATFPIVATIFFFVLFANWLGLIPGVGAFGVCRAHETHGEEQTHAQVIEMRLASLGAVDSGKPLVLAAEGEEEGAAAEEEHGSGGMILGCEPGESIVPMFRSPSADLNFTFGLALLAFLYIEYIGFQALGVGGYLGKFFNVKDGVMGFLVGLLELISEFARILAFAFRLFGNIFAGEVLLVVMSFLVPLVLPLPFYMFEVFVGFIQAFVFAILTMAFIAIAVTPHGGDHH